MNWPLVLRRLRLISVVLGAVLVHACGSDNPPSAPSPSTGSGSSGGSPLTVTISIVSNSGSQAFAPNPATVPAGQALVFRNSTGSTHRIVADNGAWDTGALSSGSSSATIPSAGGVSFHCAIHSSMVGTIVPGP